LGPEIEQIRLAEIDAKKLAQDLEDSLLEKSM
jgi:hypothetical protein